MFRTHFDFLTFNRIISAGDIKYDYEIISEYDFTLYDGIKIEHILHDYFHTHKYIPNIKFKGYTECFSFIDLDEIKMIIDDYKKE